jgi:hypothetical protein
MLALWVKCMKMAKWEKYARLDRKKRSRGRWEKYARMGMKELRNERMKVEK